MNKPIATTRKATFGTPDSLPGTLSAASAASLLAAVGDVRGSIELSLDLLCRGEGRALGQGLCHLAQFNAVQM